MNRRWIWMLAVCCAGAGACKRSETPRPDALALAVQQKLAERETKLNRYRFAGRADRPGKTPLAFEFAYRAPGRMRGRLFEPQEHVLAFDGQSVYEVLPAQKLFRTLKLPEAPADRALRVSERFAPFIPEGFKTPLLPWSSVKAQQVSHPRAPEAVALKATLSDATGQPLTVTYTLRWPSMDFLVKRMEGGGGVAELRLDEEQCEERLAICLPLRISQWKDGVRVGGTQVLELELLQAPPAEDFTLTAPAGFTPVTGDL